jgi:hypothetical protein
MRPADWLVLDVVVRLRRLGFVLGEADVAGGAAEQRGLVARLRAELAGLRAELARRWSRDAGWSCGSRSWNVS